MKEFTGNIEFETEYVSLSFPDRILYQTRLLGFNENWSDENSHNSIVYTNLSPGNYVFQVRAKQSGYFWSEVAEIHFKVVPPWYFTWWMLSVYILAFIVIIIVITVALQRKRIKNMEIRQRELERIVELKTKDLVEEKERTLKLLRETEKAKKEIERVNEDLRNANQLKSDLLSIAAHDLKNPLGSIIGFSRFIKEESENPNIIEMINIIHESSIRMLNLITEILESVAIESTKLNLKIEPVSFKELCVKVIENNSPRARMKNQEIISNIDDNSVVDADEKWMREALDNLLSNAIKYSPKNKAIRISLESENGFVRFSVKDEGPGLTEKDKNDLFKKFTRLSAQPTGGESSTGLGLSIVKEIVQLHNGKIWAESEPAKGANFIIELKKSA